MTGSLEQRIGIDVLFQQEVQIDSHLQAGIRVTVKLSEHHTGSVHIFFLIS
jgi:hypothetical protein